MALSDLATLIDASSQNLYQFKAFTVAYNLLLGGVPNIDGYTTLINTNDDTNFGAKTSTSDGPMFNQENVYINIANALYQGNPTAHSAFDAIASGASIQDQLNAVYDAVVQAADRTDAGRAAFVAQADFYAAKAAELGISGSHGAALVGFAGLLNIVVRDDLGGIGDTTNDLLAAVHDGSAMLPQSGDVFTPAETADGTNYDGDNSAMSGSTFNFTATAGETVTGTTGNDVFNAILDNTAPGNSGTFQALDHLADSGGHDTFNLYVMAGLATPPAGSSVSGAEIVNLHQGTAPFPTTGPGGTLAAGFFAGAEQIWQIDGFSNVSGLMEGQTAGFRSTTGGGFGNVVEFAASASTGSVAVGGALSGSTVQIFGNGLTSAHVSGSVLSPGGGVPGTLKVNVSSTGAFPASDTDVDTKVTDLHLAMTSNVNLVVGGSDAPFLTTVDASASTGGITNSSATGGNNMIALMNVMGGSGNDNQTIDLASFKAPAVAFDGNGGNDMLHIVAEVRQARRRLPCR